MGMVSYIGRGIYSVPRAACLAGARPDSVRRWTVSRTDSSGPVIRSDYPLIDHEITLSFLDLVEIQFIARLRKERVSLQKLREAHVFISGEFNVPHPFAWKKLETDGRDLFIRFLEEDTGDSLIIKATGRRKANTVFPEVIEPYFHNIDFSPTTFLAERYYPQGPDGGVVLDPRVALGQPVVAGTRILTSTVADLLKAGDSSETISRWYGLTPEQVKQAWVFESGLRCAA